MRRFGFLVTIASVLALSVAEPSWATPPKLSTNGTQDFQYGTSVESHGGPATGYKQESKLFYTGDGNSEPVRWWGYSARAGIRVLGGRLALGARGSRLALATQAAGCGCLDEGGRPVRRLDGIRLAPGQRELGHRQPAAERALPDPLRGERHLGLDPRSDARHEPRSESLTIAKDGAGRLWSVRGRAQDQGQVHLAGRYGVHLQDLPTPNVNADDVSNIVAFGGDKIGVMWSNQAERKVFFAWRRDADPIDSWTIETYRRRGRRMPDGQRDELCRRPCEPHELRR